jgi:phosphatidyl-myo-inositol dimannoside synthase
MRLSGRSLWVMAKGFAPDEGGQQMYAEQVALAYQRLGASVTVFTQTSAGPRRTLHHAMTLIDIGAGKSVAVPFKWIAALRRELRVAGKPDFLHATTWRTSVPPMLLGLRYAATFHGREFMYVRGIAKRILRSAARRASPPIAVSHYSGAKLTERLGKDVSPPVIAWNGTSFDPLPRASVPSATVNIMTLCRLEPRKNILAALQAAAFLKQSGLKFHYRICGRGPDYQMLCDYVTAQNLGSHIEMLGFVSSAQVRQLYAEADIFLHPQIALDEGRDFEGFGIAIADAMLAGCAAIVGSEGGPAELVEDAVSGLIVDGRDVGAIAAALRVMITDPDSQHKMAKAGREFVADIMTWDKHVALILDAGGY